MTVSEFIAVSTAGNVMVIDQSETRMYDADTVNTLISKYGSRDIYLITPTAEDHIELILKKAR